MQGGALDVLADQAAAAIQAVHASGAVNAASLAAARELHQTVCRHASAHQVAFRLAVPNRPPEVQHFGFQVLLAALKARSPPLGQAERAETRAWLATNLTSDRWSNTTAAPYARAKCAEVVASLARLDWPTDWPELSRVLFQLASAPAPGSAALALGVWCQIADLLIEDSKELTVSRRRDLSSALIAVVEQPAEAPELIVSLQHALRQHGADQHVVREALNLCRALANAVPVRTLLQHSLDQIIRVGLDVPELCGLAVSALADWVEKVFPPGKLKEGQKHVVRSHDLCRFNALLVQLARKCVFDGNQLAYEFHCQVAELISDFCAVNAENLSYFLPSSDLGALWAGLLHLLRYPSVTVQLDAITGMCQLAKATPNTWNNSGSSPPRPGLEELLGIMFVHVLRLDAFPIGNVAAHRSEWLLRCLGAPSTSLPVTTFSVWCQLLSQTHAFEVREGSQGSEERANLFGRLKTSVLELVQRICKPEANSSATEGYAALCRITSLFAARALTSGGVGQEVWIPEFDAALVLVERPGSAALRAAEKPPAAHLSMALEPSLAFLQQVTMPAVTFSSDLEHRRLEFLSHWAVFYRHYNPDVVGQVLQRLVQVIENPPADDAVKLQRRALDTLVSLGKRGALRPAQLEALNTECQRLATKLTPVARGKLVEALAAAVAACPNLELPRRSQLICMMMDQATSAWRSSDLVHSGGSERLLAVLTAAATAPPGGTSHFDEPNMAKLRDVRTLVQAFTGVITKTASASAGPTGIDHDMSGDGVSSNADAKTVNDNSGAVKGHIAAQVVQAWAPGVFAFARSLAGVHAVQAGSNDLPSSILLRSPGLTELEHILGRRVEDIAEEFPAGVDAKTVRAARNVFWELQVSALGAVRACMACSNLWQSPEVCGWVKCLAEMLPVLQPHFATLLLKEVFLPVFGQPVTGFRELPSQVHGPACQAVVPALVAGIRQLLRKCWGPHVHAGTKHEELEMAFATSAVAFSRAAGQILAGLCGNGMPWAGQLSNPEKRLFLRSAVARSAPPASAPPPAPPGKKRKNRNKNRFAALGEDADDSMEVPGNGGDAAHPEPEPQLPVGASAFVIRSRELREAVRLGLSELLMLPEKDTVLFALAGLHVWSTQLWNSITRGEDPAAVAAGVTADHLPEVGELLHAASDALRALPSGILRPVAGLAAKPPAIGSATASTNAASANPSGDALLVAPCSTLVTLVEQTWSSFVSATSVHGKNSPSPLVIECTPVILVSLWILSRLFKIQCRKLDVKTGLEHAYLCPALAETATVFRGLPNTTEHDVTTLLGQFLSEEYASDAQRSAVRVLLHEASPACAAQQECE